MAELVLIAKCTYVWLDQLSRAVRTAIRTPRPDPRRGARRAARARASPASGSSACGSAATPRSASSSCAATPRPWRPPTRSSTTGSRTTWAARPPGATCATGLRRAASASRPTWCPTTWASTPAGSSSTPSGSSRARDPPFQAYSFDGPDLSADERVGIYLEDHYWDSSDAAVVFKRIDRWSGETRYIYHGNDGTSFPWNDTAQLDYLRAEVREAVIRQILEVARRFPVIRFDAAMVLARAPHPAPLVPAARAARRASRRAPSRPCRATSFERRMPDEFWREVVDRVAAEAPDTLLLAEAFWLLEGYFVRTLGMHRVYNSAFMHMLRDENNAEYQQVIRETVRVRRRASSGRYVNFMNNPDERTAIDQFGSGDKYFGVATLLATLPGLPMFGHGQVEGFGEQYGMEFRRPHARRDARTRTSSRGIGATSSRCSSSAGGSRAPRASGSSRPREGGAEVTDVFAYANRAQSGPRGATERRSLVVYLNRYPRAHVRIRGRRRGPRPRGRPGCASSSCTTIAPASTTCASCDDLRERGLELALDGYRCHRLPRLRGRRRTPGWLGELARRIGLEGSRMPMRRCGDCSMSRCARQCGALPRIRSSRLSCAGAGRPQTSRMLRRGRDRGISTRRWTAATRQRWRASRRARPT